MNCELLTVASPLSPWGAVVVALLAAVAAGVFWLVDRRMLVRLLRAAGLLLLGLLVVAAFVWGVYRLDSWWANVGWLLLASGGAAVAAYARARLHDRRLLMPLFLGLLGGSSVLGFSMLLTLRAMPARTMLVPVVAVMLSMLTEACAATLQTYEASLRHTAHHRRYLLANGATAFEALMPTIRRALRAAVLPLLGSASVPLLGVMPLLLGGLLVGGVPPTEALAVSALFVVAAFAASVLAAVIIVLWRCFAGTSPQENTNA